jgi:hypothetical protein
VSQVPPIRLLAIAASPAHPPNLAYRARKPRSLLSHEDQARRAAVDAAAAEAKPVPPPPRNPAADRESDPRAVGVHRQTLRQTLSREVALFDSAHFLPLIFEGGN